MTVRPGLALGKVGFELQGRLIESGDLDSGLAEFGRLSEALSHFEIPECVGTRGGSGPA